MNGGIEMKNMKIAAAAMVMVMLASAAIVGIGASAYDAEDNTQADNVQDGTSAHPYEYTVNLSNKDSATIELMSNINYYGALGGASISWSIASSNADSTVTITPSVKETIDQNVKKLTATIEKGNKKETVFTLEATITVEKNGAKVELSPITYKVTVKIENATSLTFNEMTFIRNVSDSQTLVTDNSAFGNSPLFYATGLPDGLSMTPDGKISGIPAKTAQTKTAKVFIENENGTVFTGELRVNIENFAYSVYASDTIGADSTPLADTGSTYIIEEGQKLSVKTETEGANYISVCDGSGASKLVSINGNTCNLSDYTSGTGAYKVYIGCADGESGPLNKVLASFDLYVVGHVVGIGSDIIIGSR